MDALLLVPLVAIVFLAVLLTGRAELIRGGASVATANGATLLTLAVIVGLLAIGAVASLDVW